MKKVVILMLVLAPMFASAQQDESQVLIDKFFELYKTSGPNDAMKFALNTNKWLAPEGEFQQAPFRKLGKVTASMGKITSIEVITMKSVGSRIRIASYVVHYEKQPLLLSFELYKNKDNWEFANVDFAKKPEKMLLASARNF